MNDALRTLKNLRTFAQSVDNDGERAELRPYLLAHATELAAAFGVADGKFRDSVSAVADDETLVLALINTIDGRIPTARKNATDAAHREAMNALAAVAASWLPLGHGAVGFRPEAFLAAVPAATVARFVTVALASGDSVSLPTSLLRKIKSLPRKTWRLSWVDAQGFHFRWTTGGLNLTPRVVWPPHAPTVVIAPPAPKSARISQASETKPPPATLAA